MKVNGVDRIFLYHYESLRHSVLPKRIGLYDLNNYYQIKGEFFLLYAWLYFGAMKHNNKLYFSYCAMHHPIHSYRYILLMCLLTTCNNPKKGFLVYDTVCSHPTQRVYIIFGKRNSILLHFYKFLIDYSLDSDETFKEYECRPEIVVNDCEFYPANDFRGWKW